MRPARAGPEAGAPLHENLLSLLRMHWDHEPARPRKRGNGKGCRGRERERGEGEEILRLRPGGGCLKMRPFPIAPRKWACRTCGSVYHERAAATIARPVTSDAR